jgi:hypothetical protein
MAPCRLIGRYQRFGGVFCFHLQGIIELLSRLLILLRDLLLHGFCMCNITFCLTYEFHRSAKLVFFYRDHNELENNLGQFVSGETIPVKSRSKDL